MYTRRSSHSLALVSLTMMLSLAIVAAVHQRALATPARSAVAASECTLHVATTGDDADPGTAEKPYRTIQQGADSAQPGDVVCIKPGVYNERVVIRNSGTQSLPIVFQGERGPEGEWLSVLDGSDPVGSWVRDESRGFGVYRTTAIDYEPATMVVGDKDIPRLYCMSAASCRGSWKYHGFDYINKPADDVVVTMYNKTEVNYWDGIEALYGSENGVTYLRFRNGDDPNQMNIRSAPAGAAVLIQDKAHIVVRGLKIQGAQVGMRINGSGASHNIVEQNHIINGQVRVEISSGASFNHIRSNILQMNGLSDIWPGAWSGGQHTEDPYSYGVREHIYNANKHEIGDGVTGTYSPGDDRGICLSGWLVSTAGDAGAGPHNEIYANEIFETLSAIDTHNFRNDLKVYDNVIHHTSSGALGAGPRSLKVEYYDNLVYDTNMSFRFQNIEIGGRKAYLYRNRLWNPEGVGKHFYFHRAAPEVSASGRPEIYVYQNSFSGGYGSLSVSGYVLDTDGLELSQSLFVNNVFSSPRLWNYGRKYYGTFDYNWCGGSGCNGDHNIDASGSFLWPNDKLPDFLLPETSTAHNAGIDLSRPFTINGMERPPLPGMEPGYFSGAAPDLGAVQSGKQAFLDVPISHWASAYIEVLYREGYVAGCSTDPPLYCPEATMTRAEGAVFVERGIHGAGYLPPGPTEVIFDDVPLNEWFAKWATALWNESYTAGCGTEPLIYCPLRGHTRAEAAVFFERMLHGADFVPQEAAVQAFEDVPVGAGAPWFSKWVMAAHRDGLVQDCEAPGERGDARYRPSEGITRAEAACMLDKARGMPVPVRSEFAPSTETFANPERGFMRQVAVWADGSESFWGISHPRHPADTLVWIYFRLDNYRTRPLDQEALGRTEAAFAEARGAGMKVIPRFIYSTGSWTPDPSEMVPDAELGQVLEHIEQLKPVLEDNADVLAALQAGFVGHWGEWHSSKHNLTSPENQRAILEALINALPPERMLQVRYPRDKEAHYGGPLSEEEAFSGRAAARIGHHNDCFLASEDDKGTYRSIPRSSPSEEIITYWKTFVGAEGRHTPVGGETCAPNPPRTSCMTALQELERLHWSFLNNGYNREVLEGWQRGGCLETIRRRLGYRLTLTDAVMPAALRPGSAFDLGVHLRNEGFAAPFNARPVYVVLDDPNLRYEVELPGVDPRRWKPGMDHTLHARLRLPEDVPVGTYRISLWLPDPWETLRDEPRYALRFANEGIWEAERGLNVLTTDFRVAAGAPGFEDTSALEMAAPDS